MRWWLVVGLVGCEVKVDVPSPQALPAEQPPPASPAATGSSEGPDGMTIVLNGQTLQVGGPELAGDGVAGNDARALTPFESVETRGAIDVTVQVGGDPGAEVQCDQNLLAKVHTDVVDGALRVWTDPIAPTRPCSVSVGAPRLIAVDVAGSGDLRAEVVDADLRSVSVSGSGSATLSGVGETVEVAVRGSGDVQGRSWRVRDANLRVSGSGAIAVDVEQRADARVSGSGTVTVVGPATISRDVSGSGQVRSEPR